MGHLVNVSDLCTLISQSKSLATLNLINNSIKDFGVSAIAEAIKQSKSLTKVDLSFNLFSSFGRAAITEALKQNTAVAVLIRYRR